MDMCIVYSMSTSNISISNVPTDQVVGGVTPPPPRNGPACRRVAQLGKFRPMGDDYAFRF